MQVAVHPLSSPSDTTHTHRQYYPPTPTSPCHRSNPPSRRASMALPAPMLSRNKSTKSLRDNCRSTGSLSSSKPKPRRLIGDYYVGKTLGKGASGRVKLGIHRHTGEQVAIKIISKTHLAANPAIEKAVRREIAIMKLIRHPNVMGLVDVIDDENSSDLHLILEYVEGGELFEYLVSKGRLSENEARHHFQQIILGLDYCHHHLICHRDLKPENLLLGRDHNIKIADFGMASLQPTGSMLETSCGSPHYASPEIVAGMPYNGSASDIWSCGVILYALLTGHLPFDDDNIRQLLKKVKLGKYTMPDTISRKAQDLLQRILVVDPNKRIKMHEIITHPWFCETKPANLASLPLPPSPEDIGRPIQDPTEIDDRILETLKFLWGETQDERMIRELVSKEPNMHKVVYVLLQQHAERYWQTEHADDEESDNNDDVLYCDMSPGMSRQHYATSTHRPERDRRCMSMSEHRRSQHRPVAPWMPEPSKSVSRRYSAASVRTDRACQEMMYPQLAPPLPSLPFPVQQEADVKQVPNLIKKSQTFYARIVKGMLSPTRRQSKDSSSKNANPVATVSSPQPVTGTLTGTLRNKNPFSKGEQNDTPFLPSRRASKTPQPPPKSSLRHPGQLLQRSKVEPEVVSPTSPQPPQSSEVRRSIINPKRLSIRVPQAFLGDDKKLGLFTIGGGQTSHRRQRKELQMSVFDPLEDSSGLLPPPVLSEGSTLSSTSTSSCSSHGSAQRQQQSNAVDMHASGFKTVMTSVNKPSCSTPTSPSHLAHPAVDPALSVRRGSQASILSFDRRGSDQSAVTHRAATPSLLSYSSTITTGSGNSPVSPNPSQAKSSWLSNLFFFKQPKTCSLLVVASEIQDILPRLHLLMNQVAETRFYEKRDKYGTRYKVDIKSKEQGTKSRHVKCRMEFIRVSVDQTRTSVRFTQQQGDGVLLATVIQQVEVLLRQDTLIGSSLSA